MAETSVETTHLGLCEKSRCRFFPSEEEPCVSPFAYLRDFETRLALLEHVLDVVEMYAKPVHIPEAEKERGR